MKTITISEVEYLGLIETIKRLSNELSQLKTKPKKKVKTTQSSISNRLHGRVRLPLDLDYKKAVEDAILAKHL